MENQRQTLDAKDFFMNFTRTSEFCNHANRCSCKTVYIDCFLATTNYVAAPAARIFYSFQMQTPEKLFYNDRTFTSVLWPLLGAIALALIPPLTVLATLSYQGRISQLFFFKFSFECSVFCLIYWLLNSMIDCQ